MPTSRPGSGDELLGTGEDAEVRAAVLGRDAEGLALARRDVGTVCARRGEHGERHRLDNGHEQRARRVREIRRLPHRLEQPVEVRLGNDDAGDRVVGLAELPFELSQVRRPGARAVGHERHVLEPEAGAVEVGPQDLPAVVRVHGPRDEHPAAAGRPAGHEAGLGRRGAAPS